MERPNSKTTTTHVSGMTYFLSEEMLTEILTRLPLRSISRFKSVCKTWKSTLESVYFRRLFVSVHQNTSSSWSLLLPQSELIEFHGCQTWGLPKSLGSYIQDIEINGKINYEAYSNGLVLMDGYRGVLYVGNPLLQQWVEVPSSQYPASLPHGLVTRVDEDGVVLSFKVLTLAGMAPAPSLDNKSSTCLCICVYSSETGIWTYKRLHCPYYMTNFSLPIALNETLYLSPSGYDSDLAVPGVLIAHDFYGESNLCRVIPLPDHNVNHNSVFKRAYTTSNGFVMYIKTFDHNFLKIWRLLDSDDDSGWQLEWKLPLPFIPLDDDISYYAPLAMHPFDRNIVYIWSQQNRYLVSCNLETLNYTILVKGNDQSIDHLQNCFVNQSVVEEDMDETFGLMSEQDYIVPIITFHSLLPRWIESMPCPPQIDMIDTTSLLSNIYSKRNKNRGK